MFKNKNQKAFRAAALGLGLLLIVVSSSGCMKVMSQIMYVVKGHDVPAAYPGLEDKTVAVVCVTDSTAYGPDSLGETVSKAIMMKFAQGVKKIKLVPYSEIESWIDVNGWGEVDFEALGKGVGADRVVAIELGNYSIHEGPTLYKGKADITATVYDLEDKSGASVAFIYGPNNYEFPKNPRPAIQTNDRQFEAFFLARMTQTIAYQFVKHDKLESFAEDAMIAY